MPTRHDVVQGDCINSIAAAYGFFPDTLWKDAGNDALRDLRKDPNALLPGDVVSIPDKRERLDAVATERRHTFKRKGVPAVFRLQIFGESGKAAGEKWAADVDGVKESGTCDADGVVTLAIPPNARVIELAVAGEKHVFQLGTIDPASEVTGAQGRLTNLGFGPLEPTGTLDDPTVAALRAFQRACGLDPSGSLDAATRDKLQEMHDTVTDQGPGGAPSKEPIPDDAGDEGDDGDGDENLI